MTAEHAANFQAAASGTPTKGMATRPQTADPATIVAVSSIGSPPGADLRSAFHPACRSPAASTASVTPSESSVTATGPRSRGVRLALLPLRGLRLAVRRRAVRGLAVDGGVAAPATVRPLRLRFLQARLREHACLLEDRIGDRADVRIDPLQVRDEVEVQGRRFDALDGLARQPLQMRIGVRALEVPKQHLLREKLLRSLEL